MAHTDLSLPGRPHLSFNEIFEGSRSITCILTILQSHNLPADPFCPVDIPDLVERKDIPRQLVVASLSKKGLLGVQA